VERTSDLAVIEHQLRNAANMARVLFVDGAETNSAAIKPASTSGMTANTQTRIAKISRSSAVRCDSEAMGILRHGKSSRGVSHAAIFFGRHFS
jgi:hypothetical protein